MSAQVQSAQEFPSYDHAYKGHTVDVMVGFTPLCGESDLHHVHGECDVILMLARVSSIYFSYHSHFVQIGVSGVHNITKVSHDISTTAGALGDVRTQGSLTLIMMTLQCREGEEGMERWGRVSEGCKVDWQQAFRLPRTVGELGLSRQPSSNGRVRASLSQSSPHQTTQQFHRQLSI